MLTSSQMAELRAKIHAACFTRARFTAAQMGMEPWQPRKVECMEAEAALEMFLESISQQPENIA